MLADASRRNKEGFPASLSSGAFWSSRPIPHITDAVVVVDETRLHVSKVHYSILVVFRNVSRFWNFFFGENRLVSVQAHLATVSKYFYRAFYLDGLQEVVVDDVSLLDFRCLLRVRVFHFLKAREESKLVIFSKSCVFFSV